MDQIEEAYLSPTSIIDSDHPEIIAYAMNTVGDAAAPLEKAVKLYYAVRDGIRYTPYYPFYLPKHYRASNVLRSGSGYCVCKASLLCALGRACRIPSRIGFAHVRNHLSTKQLADYMGTDLFVYHGFTEFFLQGKWVKATPAFNAALCRMHRVLPLEFNGMEDSIFQPYNEDREQFMEYVEDLGTRADIPVEEIVAAWKQAYGTERVEQWIQSFEETGGASPRDFEREDVLKK